jgi:hypothetical protein
MCDSITNGYAAPIYINTAGGGGNGSLWITTLLGNVATGQGVSIGTVADPPPGYQLYVYGNSFFSNLTSNIVSPVSTGSTYLTGNLVVSGNVYSSQTQQGGAIYYILSSVYTPSSYTGAVYGTTYTVRLTQFTPNGTSTYFNVSPNGFLQFSQTGVYQISGIFLSDFNNINGIAIGSNTSDTSPNSSQTYLYRYTTTISQNPTEPLTIQFYVSSTTNYYYIDLFASGAFILQPTSSGLGGTWITVAPYAPGITVTTGTPAASSTNGFYLNPSTYNNAAIQNYISSLIVPRSFWADSSFPSFSCIISSTTKSFFGGVCLPTGRILFAPYNTTNPGIYNPLQDQYSDMTVSVSIPAQAYHGGVLLPSGKIVFIPYNSPSISIYVNESTTMTDMYTHGVAAPAFSGGVLDPNGNVVMIPCSTTSNICTYNPNNNTFSNVVKINADGTFSGGVLLPNGNIVCVANTNSNICQFNPFNGTVSNSVSVNSSKYLGGVLAPNGNVILVGSNVGVFNPYVGTLTNIKTNTKPYGFSGGCLLPTGQIVLAPFNSSNVGLVDPINLTYSNSTPVPSDLQFSGATLLFDGRVVLTPYSGYVGVLSTVTPAPSREFCLSPYFNNF